MLSTTVAIVRSFCKIHHIQVDCITKADLLLSAYGCTSRTLEKHFNCLSPVCFKLIDM